MKTKKAIINTFVIILYQVLNMVIGLILPKFYTETFGSSYNGLNQTIKQIMTWLGFLNAGIMAAAIQALFKPIAEKNTNSIYSVLCFIKKQCFKMGSIFIALLSAIAIIWGVIGNSEVPVTVIVYTLLVHGISSVITSFFLAKFTVYVAATNKNYIIYFINILSLILSSILKIVVLSLYKNIYIYQAILLLDPLVRGIFLYIVCKKDFKKFKNTAVVTENIQIAQRKDVLVGELAGFVINSTDVLLISYFLDFSQASIYSMYAFVVSSVVNILASIREGAYSGIGHLISTDKEKFKKSFSSFESIFFAMMFLLFSITIVAYRPFIKVYTAKMDQNYVFMFLPILFVLTQLLVYLRIPSIMAANSAGHFKQTKNFAVIEAIINLVLSIILIQLMGIEGALIGTIIGGLYRTTVYVNYCNKNILERKNSVYLKKISILALPFVIAVIFSFFDWTVATLIEWIFFASIVGIIFLSIYVVLLIIMEKDYLTVLLKNIFRRKNK